MENCQTENTKGEKEGKNSQAKKSSKIIIKERRS